VLAHRLTDGRRHRVLLLEAGGSERRFWLQVPIGYGKSFYDPRLHAEIGPAGPARTVLDRARACARVAAPRQARGAAHCR
jgi:choline dehydrogenase-like flavoprotein